MPAPLSPADRGRYIDHTLSRPEASAKDIERLCAEGAEFRFAAVCVNPSRVELARHWLESTDVKVAALVGFPLGATDSDTKRFETEAAIDNGAQEIDLVLDLGRLKDGDDKHVLRELRDVVEAAEERPVKVTLETGLLTREEIIRACGLVQESGAACVGASAGFGQRAARLEDVRLLRATLGPKFGVKAAGEIGSLAEALALIAAGATRLGTPHGVAIVKAVPAADGGN